MALLDEACPWRWFLRFQKSMLGPVPLQLQLEDQMEVLVTTPAPYLAVTMILTTMVMDLSSEKVSNPQIKRFPPLVMVSLYNNRKVTMTFLLELLASEVP